MSQLHGKLCIVLHGHLPYVLNHGSYPHGEAWLYEAAAETYLPLLDMIGEVALQRVKPAITIGLTPILLEQLAHPRFKTGFVAYLAERRQRAAADRKEFERDNSLHFAQLASQWEQWYGHISEIFERIKRDIPAEFAARCREGHVQLLTSNATHAYMPLLLNDQMIKAQIACGTFTSHKHLGLNPYGLWLPECAYRPSCEQWLPSVLYEDPRNRAGLETFIAAAGLTHFFVDTHLISGAQPMGVMEKGHLLPASQAGMHWDTNRGWGSVLDPVGVVSSYQEPQVYAFARHPGVGEQVWSAARGYPGDGAYLDFHRKYGDHGLRYHKVTTNTTPLGDKEPYDPQNVPGKVFEHAQHFCNVVRDTLRDYHDQTGRQGTVVAAFDAELFGHWWFEGIRFLRDVMLTLNAADDVQLSTVENALQNTARDKVVRMPEGSWGENGNHTVWINDKNRWMWEIEYRAEGQFLQLLHDLPWRSKPHLKEMMARGARQLLLLQASDWPFVVHTGGAVDYGIQRFSGHATQFGRAMDIAQHLAGGNALTPMQQTEIADMDAHDTVFPNIDLDWWKK